MNSTFYSVVLIAILAFIHHVTAFVAVGHGKLIERYQKLAKAEATQVGVVVRKGKRFDDDKEENTHRRVCKDCCHDGKCGKCWCCIANALGN